MEGSEVMTAIDKYARIDTLEMFDEYEGEYDVYFCHECDEYLTDSLQISFYEKDIPKKCPNCGKELRW